MAEQQISTNPTESFSRNTVSSISDTLGTVMEITNIFTGLGFEIAKESTKAGFNVARRVMPNLQQPFNFIEMITLQSIEIGHFWADFGLNIGDQTVSSVNHLFGQTETALAIKELLLLLRNELENQGIDELSTLDIIGGLSSWISLQESTSVHWANKIILQDTKQILCNNFQASEFKKQMIFSFATYGKTFGKLLTF